MGLHTWKRKWGLVHGEIHLCVRDAVRAKGLLGVESSCLLLLEVSGRVFNPPKESSARFGRCCMAGQHAGFKLTGSGDMRGGG